MKTAITRTTATPPTIVPPLVDVMMLVLQLLASAKEKRWLLLLTRVRVDDKILLQAIQVRGEDDCCFQL